MSAPALRSQGGQMITEAVLILVILCGVTFMVSRYFRDEEILKQLITGPFQNLAGLLQNGVWAPPEVGVTSHPNKHNRHVVIQGERAQ